MAVDNLARAMAAHADSKAVTAYQYAVAGGYTGTEAQFTEDLGNLAENADAVNNSVRYDEAQSKTDAQKRQAIQNLSVYDDITQIIKITDTTTTMGDVFAQLNGTGGVNVEGDHVLFDVATLGAGMYLVTIFLNQGFFRIADLVTGFEKTGFYSNSDLLVDILKSQSTTTGKHYTIQWDKTSAQCTRLNDATSITTNTANFGHFGSVNANYDNPFDSIYPWSGRKLCNIDLDLYMALESGDDLTSCVTAWEGDVNFDYENQYGIWVYTPAFFGRAFEVGNYRYFDVSDELTQGAVAYPEMITGRWLGVDVTLTINGASKHCNIPKVGMPMANVTLANMHTYAKNYKATLGNIFTLDASALLMVVEYATMDSQTAVGSGCSSLYKQTMHVDADVTANDTIQITASGLASLIKAGTIVDIGTADGGYDIARTYIVSSSLSGNVATIVLADLVTVTTDQFVSFHGIINVADEDIGSKSGYIGTNGYVNAYYRGECLWGNKYQYILGAYRQTGTGEVWIAKDVDPDDYDALNTSVHTDTGVALTETSGYILTLGECNGLCIPPFCTSVGGTSANPVGDYYYVPALSTDNTVLLLGGYASYGPFDGLFFGNWIFTASYSSWAGGSRPLLKNP